MADNIQQMEAQSACEHVFLGEVDNNGGFCIGILEVGLFCCRLSVCGVSTTTFHSITLPSSGVS